MLYLQGFRITIAKFKAVAKRIQQRYGSMRAVASFECLSIRDIVPITAMSRAKMSIKPSSGF
ncbi:MAG: hypothetical protein QXU31_01670 [Archaeoglobaceae archaeon]